MGAGSKGTAATGALCPPVVTLCPPARHPAVLQGCPYTLPGPGELLLLGRAVGKAVPAGKILQEVVPGSVACTPAAMRRRRRVGSLHRAVSSSNGLCCGLKAQGHLCLQEERGIPRAILFSPRVGEAQPSWTLLPSGQQPVPPMEHHHVRLHLHTCSAVSPSLTTAHPWARCWLQGTARPRGVRGWRVTQPGCVGHHYLC